MTSAWRRRLVKAGGARAWATLGLILAGAIPSGVAQPTRARITIDAARVEAA